MFYGDIKFFKISRYFTSVIDTLLKVHTNLLVIINGLNFIGNRYHTKLGKYLINRLIKHWKNLLDNVMPKQKTYSKREYMIISSLMWYVAYLNYLPSQVLMDYTCKW